MRSDRQDHSVADSASALPVQTVVIVVLGMLISLVHNNPNVGDGSSCAGRYE